MSARKHKITTWHRRRIEREEALILEADQGLPLPDCDGCRALGRVCGPCDQGFKASDFAHYSKVKRLKKLVYADFPKHSQSHFDRLENKRPIKRAVLWSPQLKRALLPRYS